MSERRVPSEMQPVSEQERLFEQVSVFVANLKKTGIQKLVSPPPLKGRNFFVTCRTIDNPNVPTKQIDSLKFSQMGGWSNGFTDAYIVDLFEEIPAGSNTFVPVGHRDVRVVHFSDNDDIKASGNFAISRQYSKHAKTQLDESFSQATELADNIWGMNGVDVLDSLQENSQQDVDQEVLKTSLKEKGISESQSWRRLGFGKLLVGLELELLKQKGVKKLESPSISDELSGIFNKIAESNPSVISAGESLDISKIKPADYSSFVAPFIIEEK